MTAPIKNNSIWRMGRRRMVPTTKVVATTPNAANQRSRINQETRSMSSSSTGKRKGASSHFCWGPAKKILPYLGWQFNEKNERDVLLIKGEKNVNFFSFPRGR